MNAKLYRYSSFISIVSQIVHDTVHAELGRHADRYEDSNFHLSSTARRTHDWRHVLGPVRRHRRQNFIRHHGHRVVLFHHCRLSHRGRGSHRGGDPLARRGARHRRRQLVRRRSSQSYTFLLDSNRYVNVCTVTFDAYMSIASNMQRKSINLYLSML